MESKKKVYTKEELRNELFTLIRQIGKERADSFVFDLNNLLVRWERRPELQPFRLYGFGKKLTSFLKEDCGALESPGKEFYIPKKVMFKADAVVKRHEDEDRCEATPPEPRENVIKPDDARLIQSKDNPFIQAQPESHAAARQKQLFDLKFEVFKILKDLLETEKYRRKGEVYVSHDELQCRWRRSHQNEKKFKSYGFGNFRDFLIRHCEIKQDERRNKFQIARMMVEKELDEFKTRKSELNTSGILERDGQESKEEGNVENVNESESEHDEVTAEPVQEEARDLGNKSELEEVAAGPIQEEASDLSNKSERDEVTEKPVEEEARDLNNKAERDEVTPEPVQEEASDLGSKAAAFSTTKVAYTPADSCGGASEDSLSTENLLGRKCLATNDTAPEHRLPQSK